MASTALDARPQCKQHGPMELRNPPGGWTREQHFCGTWYDCQSCRSSVLLRGPELQAQLDTQRRSIRTYQSDALGTVTIPEDDA